MRGRSVNPRWTFVELERLSDLTLEQVSHLELQLSQEHSPARLDPRSFGRLLDYRLERLRTRLAVSPTPPRVRASNDVQ